MSISLGAGPPLRDRSGAFPPSRVTLGARCPLGVLPGVPLRVYLRPFRKLLKLAENSLKIGEQDSRVEPCCRRAMDKSHDGLGDRGLPNRVG